MVASFIKKVAVVYAMVAFLSTATVAAEGDGKHSPFRGQSTEEKETDGPSYAVVEGHIWFDENRNGVQDEDERGLEDVLVELRSSDREASLDHAVETGSDGEFQFILDALDFDVDSHGDNEFYVQVYAPDGYKFSLPTAALHDGGARDQDEIQTSSPFQITLGETYRVDTGLVTACDPSLGFLAFSGIKAASSLGDGSMEIEWDPASFLSFDEDNPTTCDDGMINYDIFIVQMPFDFTSFSVPDLYELSKSSDDIIHVETDELDVIIGGLEADSEYSVLVMSSMGGIFSDYWEQPAMSVKVSISYEDRLSVDEETDDEYHHLRGGVLAHVPTIHQHQLSSTRRAQESITPVLNELMFLPSPGSPDFKKRRAFIEIYRPDTTYSFAGCALESIDGSLRVEFGRSFDSVISPYFVVKHKASLRTESLLWKRKGILWLRDLPLKAAADGIALTCEKGRIMVDFVAWGNRGEAPSGTLVNSAVEAGMWSGASDFVATSGLKTGDSIGRDRASTDSNSPRDWSYPGGLNARGASPGSQNQDYSALPMLNEVILLPKPLSRAFAERRKFIEIYLPDPSFNLYGCALVSDSGSFRLDFPRSIGSISTGYLAVKHKSTLKRKIDLWRSKGIMWMRDFELGVSPEGLALICDDSIVDYVAWGKDGDGPTGSLHSEAVSTGMWSGTDDFVEIGRENLGGGYISPGMEAGDSLGRDGDSTDTDAPRDWTTKGGRHARTPTPSSKNRLYSAVPLINELIFVPEPGSSNFGRRRVFIEIYRRDTSYRLSGCTITNNDGSFSFTFGKAFNNVDHPYLSLKHKSSLKRKSELWRRKGIVWVRDMPLEEIDSAALFCDGVMVDYVAWGKDGVWWNGVLHETAVASGMWSSTQSGEARKLQTGDYVETDDLQAGDSLGRDKESTDTNSAKDWAFPGGKDADDSTPSAQNGPVCDPASGSLSFFGALLGASIDRGTLYLEWDEAVLVPKDDVSSLDCEDPIYSILVADSPFNFTEYTVPELMELSETSDSLARIESAELEIMLTDQIPNKTLSVLVVASVENKIFSEMGEGIDITISGVDAVVNRNVTKLIGPFEPDEAFLIDYNASSSQLAFQGEIPSNIRGELEEMSFLSVITSNDEPFYFYIESIIESDASSSIHMAVREAALTEIFEELSLDITADAGSWAASANATDSNPNRRRLRTFTLLDRTVGEEQTKTYGPLTLQAKYKLRAYLRVRASISVSFFSGISASAVVTAGGTSDVLVSVSYADGVSHTVSFIENIWKGPIARITFTVFAWPVWINLQPKLDVKGSVTVELEAFAVVKFEQNGAVQAFAGYEDGWVSDASSSLTNTLTAEAGARASASANAGVLLTLSISLYGVAGVDLGLEAGLKWEAEAHAISNPVLLVPSPFLLDFHFTKFDVDVYAELPATATLGSKKKQLGTLFSISYPLLRLPEAQYAKFSNICNGANAIELTAEASNKIPNPPPLILNKFEPKHQWKVDFEPPGLGVAGLVAPSYVPINDKTTQVTLALPRTAITKVQFFEIPEGMLYFRSSPMIPGLDLTLLFTIGDVVELFGKQRFECCLKEDCDLKYAPDMEYNCEDRFCVKEITIPPETTKTPTPTLSSAPSMMPSDSMMPSETPSLPPPPPPEPTTSPPSPPPTLPPTPPPTPTGPTPRPTGFPTISPTGSPTQPPSVSPTPPPTPTGPTPNPTGSPSQAPVFGDAERDEHEQQPRVDE